MFADLCKICNLFLLEFQENCWFFKSIFCENVKFGKVQKCAMASCKSVQVCNGRLHSVQKCANFANILPIPVRPTSAASPRGRAPAAPGSTGQPEQKSDHVRPFTESIMSDPPSDVTKQIGTLALNTSEPSDLSQLYLYFNNILSLHVTGNYMFSKMYWLHLRIFGIQCLTCEACKNWARNLQVPILL